MSVAERARELRAKTWTKIGFDTNQQDFTQRYDKLIEQALLAERRLAMEEAAKMCTDDYGAFSNVLTDQYRRSKAIAAKLRAAAEKEA